ncbi:hypothetical protein AALP_AAs61185U000100 [Arabis alpina]|uniref:Uncharacterized protein n=1 Tax=Arabis alpina TaxID=50452 RepID=A0A087G3W5_ARAAL|nr:hypothetical protein AALP_AAs61185U000100 [Arabis alpina]
MRGGDDFLSPPRDDSPPSDPDVKFAMSAISVRCLLAITFSWTRGMPPTRKIANSTLRTASLLQSESVTRGDSLNSRVADLISALAEAEEIKKKEDSSDDEAVEAGRTDAHDISSAESSDDEAERTEVDGQLTVARKTPALTQAEIEEVANEEAEDEADRLELQGGEGIGTVEHAEVEERTEVNAVDASTGEPIAPLFSHPKANPQDREDAP